MNISISKELLVQILTNAIEYGGDKGGPYFTDEPKYRYGKSELIRQMQKAGYEIIFDDRGDWIEDLKEITTWNNN